MVVDAGIDRVEADRGLPTQRGALYLALRQIPVIPALLLAGLVLSAAFAPLVAPYDPLKIDLTNVLAPPFFMDGGTPEHVLGTDKVGRDVLSRIIYGGRVSLLVSASVLVIGGVIGVTLGLISGFLGGRADTVIQRGSEAILSLPTLMVALVFAFVLGQSITSVILILSPFIVARFARMVRGDVLSMRGHSYVALATVAGASKPRILRKHVLPNVASTIIVIATLEIGHLILVESSLSFPGVGVPPPTPSWGSMVSDGRDYLLTKPWLSVIPGLAIVAAVLSINWIGDWLRDVLDPKLQAL